MKALVTTLFIIAVVASYPVAAQNTGQKTPGGISDAYEFPLRPGMPEWKELKSHAEMLQACEIPENILSGMSTEGLVITCLKYPLAYDFIAFDSVEQGLREVISRSNGLRELMRRRGVGTRLLSAYKNMDTATIPDCGHTPKRLCRFQFMYIELLFCQEPILSGLTTQDRNSLLESCNAKYISKRNDDSYGMLQLRTTVLAMSRILLSADYEPFKRKYDANQELKLFLDGAPITDIKALDEVSTFAEQFLAEHVGEEGE